MAQTFFQSDQQDETPLRHQLLFRLAAYLKPYGVTLLVLFLLMAMAAFLEVMPSELTLRLIDHHLEKGDLSGAGSLLWTFGLVLGMSFGINILRHALLGWVGQMAMLDLRTELFSRLMKRNTHFFHHNPVGRLMTRVTTDVQNLNEMFSSGFVAIMGDALSLLAIVIWMFYQHAGMAVLALSVMSILLVATEVFRRYASEAFRETQGRYASIQSFLQEQLSGMHLVQMHGREKDCKINFSQLNKKYLAAFLRTIFAYAVFYPVVELITTLTLAALILYAGFKLEYGEISLGLLLAFIQQSGRFFRPIRELAERYNVMQTAIASSERIFKLLDDDQSIPEAETPIPFRFEKEIAFRAVDFSYDGARRVVHGLEARIPKGRRIAVVGHTGAGKSTLINLLMRFYDVDGGVIELDGADIRTLALPELRGLFGLVLQDVFVFSGSLEFNILLGRPRDEVRLAKVLAQAQLDELVGRLEAGLLTEVGERGQRLSAGERQLLAFARMLYGNPQVLLLDEATANIDTATERKIQSVITHVSRQLTTLTVAHRLSTVQDADEIWVMDQGRIIERGDHNALMAQKGHYAKLVALQRIKAVFQS